MTRHVPSILLRSLCALLCACVAADWGYAKPPLDPFVSSSAFVQVTDQSPIELADHVATDQPLPPLVAMIPPEQNYLGVTQSNYCDGYCGGYGGGAWTWQSLPEGLIWHSFLAGPREPRIGTKFMNMSGTQENSQTIWDATVGGRRGLLRYGNCDPLRPQGWQLDIEGAALVRLNLDEERDVEASDFRFGVPLTYGAGPVQFKTGYYHLSSHLGDEFQVRNPMSTRLNYVRDAIMLGLSVNPTPEWRLYGETAYAVFTAGGAEPWEFQFGAEYSQAGPTGFAGTPFFATNAHLREELDFSGDWTTHVGWLWRNCEGNTMRVGLHYMNGKSTQYQFLNHNERQVGLGIWYDF